MPSRSTYARPTSPVVAPSFTTLADSFKRSLLAENKSPRTVETYMEGLRLFGQFLAAQGMPQRIDAISREHVESFIADLLTHYKATTAANRYCALQQFFRWAVEEGEIKASPMAHMKPPAKPEQPPEVLTDEQERKLLKVCEGNDFARRRDTAIIRLLIDTPMRRHELAALTQDNLDLDQRVCHVLGKGRRVRAVPFGHKTARALDRYLRARAQRPDAHLPALWLGLRGPMSDSGIYQALTQRAEQAGIGHVYTHLFRHTFAHGWLENEGQEGDLMQLAGWRSRSMLQRYGASAAAARARRAYQQRSPGDRL